MKRLVTQQLNHERCCEQVVVGTTRLSPDFVFEVFVSTKMKLGRIEYPIWLEYLLEMCILYEYFPPNEKYFFTAKKLEENEYADQSD